MLLPLATRGAPVATDGIPVVALLAANRKPIAADRFADADEFGADSATGACPPFLDDTVRGAPVATDGIPVVALCVVFDNTVAADRGVVPADVHALGAVDRAAIQRRTPFIAVARLKLLLFPIAAGNHCRRVVTCPPFLDDACLGAPVATDGIPVVAGFEALHKAVAADMDVAIPLRELPALIPVIEHSAFSQAMTRSYVSASPIAPCDTWYAAEDHLCGGAETRNQAAHTRSTQGGGDGDGAIPLGALLTLRLVAPVPDADASVCALFTRSLCNGTDATASEFRCSNVGWNAAVALPFYTGCASLGRGGG